MRRSLRKALSAPISLVLLTLAVAVPVMERADLSRAPVIESEHEPGSCPAPHDHRICTQVSANHAAPGADRRAGPSEAVRTIRSSDRGGHAPAARSERSAPARAPPAA